MQPINPMREFNYLIKRNAELNIIIEHHRGQWHKLEEERYQVEKKLQNIEKSKRR